MIPERQRVVVIGAGVRYAGRRLLPDVDESCAEVAGAITPRVGGVGPTTMAMLLRNAVAAAERATAPAGSRPSPGQPREALLRLTQPHAAVATNRMSATTASQSRLLTTNPTTARTSQTTSRTASRTASRGTTWSSSAAGPPG